MKFGTVSAGRYTGADRYTGVAVRRRSTVLETRTTLKLPKKSVNKLNWLNAHLINQHKTLNIVSQAIT